MYRKPSQLQAEVADVAWRARELELAEADAVGSGGGMPASSAWAGPPDAAAAAAPLGRTHMLATGGLGMQPPPDTPVNDAALEAAALMQRLVVASNRQAMVLLANEDLAGSEAWLCKAQQALYRARVTGAARFMPAGEESEGGLHVLTYNNIACFQRRAGNLNAALQCLRDAVLEGERGGATDQQLAVRVRECPLLPLPSPQHYHHKTPTPNAHTNSSTSTSTSTSSSSSSSSTTTTTTTTTTKSNTTTPTHTPCAPSPSAGHPLEPVRYSL